MVQCQPEPGSNNRYTPMLVVTAEISKGMTCNSNITTDIRQEATSGLCKAWLNK
jgi:hypothetical protein